MNILNNLTDRLKHALDVTGTKKADLARAIGVKPQVIQFLCNSKTQSSRFTFEISTALGLNTRWLATGEGEVFLADDPNRQFLNAYTRIPIFDGEGLRKIFLAGKNINEVESNAWLPLNTQEKNIFAIKMPDASMEPYIHSSATLCIRPSDDNEQYGCKFILAYLVKFDTFVVREVVREGTSIMLVPKNKELFKEIKFDSDVKMLGIVTDCFWHIGS